MRYTTDREPLAQTAYAKIKKFTILPEDFTVDNGLLTPTLKVKRKVITDKHRELLDSLYA